MSDEASASATNGEVEAKPVESVSPTASEQERPAVKPPLSSDPEKMETEEKEAEQESAEKEGEEGEEKAKEEEPPTEDAAERTETEEMAEPDSEPVPDTAPPQPSPEKEEVAPEPSIEEKKEEKADEAAPSDTEVKEKTPEPVEAPEPRSPRKRSSTKKETPVKSDNTPQKKERTPRTPREEPGSPKNEDGSEKTPILEQPLVVPEGRKRNRKSVERWKTETTVTVKEFHIPDGSGTKLGEIEYVENMISKTAAEELKTLHRVCFGTVGKSTMVKKHLRQFNGFDFKLDSEDGKKKHKSLEGMQQKMLKQLCEILGLEKSKTKEEIVNNICSFLVSPNDSGKKVPQSKRAKKRSASSKGRGRKSAKKTDSEVGSEGSGEESGGDKEEEEEEEPAPKKAKESNGKGRGRPKKEAGSKGPSDSELRTAIKKLLKGINLETVTMKEMCKKVYDNFPDTDLTSRKDFIKSSVKEIISSSD